MKDFPLFMKNPKNKIDAKYQFTEDIEGYVYDGIDGSQMAYWTCHCRREIKEHAHHFDEYMIIVKGAIILYLNCKKHVLSDGDEIYIPKGTMIRGECSAQTRTIHVFEKKRAERVRSQ